MIVGTSYRRIYNRTAAAICWIEGLYGARGIDKYIANLDGDDILLLACKRMHQLCGMSTSLFKPLAMSCLQPDLVERVADISDLGDSDEFEELKQILTHRVNLDSSFLPFL
jgi:hypothetical protein